MKCINSVPLFFLGCLAILSCSSQTSSQNDSGSRSVFSSPSNEVAIIRLEKTPFQKQIISSGKLSAASKCTLSFGKPGNLVVLNVKNGQKVYKGQPIATLDDASEKIALESAQLAFDKAGLDLFDILAGLGYKAGDTISVPSEILAMAKMRSGYFAAKNSLAFAKLDLNRTRLIAPLSGKIADMKAHLGDLYNSGPFCTIVDDRSFNVDFQILESEYSFLCSSDNIEVESYGTIGMKCHGKLQSINPVVDKNGLISVTASIKGAEGLIDGMNVRVVVGKTTDNQFVVPRNAVVVRDNLDVVFRYRDGLAEWVYVNIIDSNSTSLAISANTDRGATLSEGDMIIVSGNLNLADRSKVSLKE